MRRTVLVVVLVLLVLMLLFFLTTADPLHRFFNGIMYMHRYGNKSLANISKEYLAFERMIRYKPNNRVYTVTEIRKLMDLAIHVHPPMPPTVTAVKNQFGYWLNMPDIDTRKDILMYIHGGAYVAGSAKAVNAVAARFGLAWDFRAVCNIDYRLAPKYPMPAALQDVVAAYTWLVTQLKDDERIVVCGDSAGGGLTLLLLQWLTLNNQIHPDQVLLQPRSGVLLSPYTDLTHSSSSIMENTDTDILLGSRCTEEMLKKIQDWVCGVDLHPSDPICSPLFGSFHGLPPLSFVVSDNEILLDDTLKCVQKALDHGVTVNLKIGFGLCHSYPIFSGIFPEADPVNIKVL